MNYLIQLLQILDVFILDIKILMLIDLITLYLHIKMFLIHIVLILQVVLMVLMKTSFLILESVLKSLMIILVNSVLREIRMVREPKLLISLISFVINYNLHFQHSKNHVVINMVLQLIHSLINLLASLNIHSWVCVIQNSLTLQLNMILM